MLSSSRDWNSKRRVTYVRFQTRCVYSREEKTGRLSRLAVSSTLSSSTSEGERERSLLAARLSTTAVPRSRQEGGASCRLLALIVSRQAARADACRVPSDVPPRPRYPRSLPTTPPPSSLSSLHRLVLPERPPAPPRPRPSPRPSATPPNRATNRRLRIGVSCAGFDLRRP